MSETQPPRLLVLWGAPRTRSTAFFRMMAERGDFRSVHEPFSYLAEFGHVDLDGRLVTTQEDLIATLVAMAARSPVFVKDTTDERYEAVLADEAFLGKEATHTFLIRHPRDTISSYYALNPEVALHQVGFESQWQIFAAVSRVTGQTPIVLDSDDLVADPAAVVAGYCARVGISYRPEALTWQAGERAEWAPTARWHRDAASSQGFTGGRKRPATDVAAHPVLAGHLRHHLPFYEQMAAVRFTP